MSNVADDFNQPKRIKPSSVAYSVLSPKATATVHILGQWIVGSQAYGLAVDGSDVDYMGVCADPIASCYGLGSFEQWDGHPEYNGTIYGLRKLCRLMLKGNPTVTELLFINPQSSSKELDELLSIRDAFISDQTISACRGYLRAQRERLIGQRGQKDINRHDLVAKYGYDTKYAMHMLRLGMMGNELLTQHKLTIPMDKYKVEQLLKVRNGEFSIEWCVEQAKFLEMVMQSPENYYLPSKPDYGKVEEYLIRTLREYHQ